MTAPVRSVFVGNGVRREDPKSQDEQRGVDEQSDDDGDDLQPERVAAEGGQSRQRRGEHDVEHEDAEELEAASDATREARAIELRHVPHVGHGPLAGLGDAERSPERARPAPTARPRPLAFSSEIAS